MYTFCMVVLLSSSWLQKARITCSSGANWPVVSGFKWQADVWGSYKKAHCVYGTVTGKKQLLPFAQIAFLKADVNLALACYMEGHMNWKYSLIVLSF